MGLRDVYSVANPLTSAVEALADAGIKEGSRVSEALQCPFVSCRVDRGTETTNHTRVLVEARALGISEEPPILWCRGCGSVWQESQRDRIVPIGLLLYRELLRFKRPEIVKLARGRLPGPTVQERPASPRARGSQPFGIFAHRNLAEFDFRYNTRDLNDGDRTLVAIQRAEGKRLMLARPS